MDRQDFEYIRDVASKTIRQDIKFQALRRDGAYLAFEGVPIEAPDFPLLALRLNGSYVPRLGKIKYNVVAQGVGPICRVDVNGLVHRDVGRTHKHSLRESTDPLPGNNLPYAVARPDLEGKTPKQVFEDFCARAKIHFVGYFHEP